MRLTRFLLGLMLVGTPMTLGVREARAQAAVTAPASGPRVEELRAGYAPAAQESNAMLMSAAAKGPFGSRANGRVAAIVGGAAFVGGLLIGDDAGTVIAISGLVIGLLGLWTWLG